MLGQSIVQVSRLSGRSNDRPVNCPTLSIVHVSQLPCFRPKRSTEDALLVFEQRVMKTMDECDANVVNPLEVPVRKPIR